MVMNLMDLVKRCIRILHIARKPDNDEFSKTAKVTAFGMVVLGLIGFVVSIIFGLIKV